ncbi:tetratricopeptide repeat protein [Solihabitans fulvus]|uniref:Tetratricopeptide repeat protein n=1 Tax=Solihabitans fulvus TaxID=1892852 RepID=A0A5B2WZ85_9PSEU|nr:tetratricopeptide repeat protein [Solihabitans fulvus]KAA2256941.1 tetratricopeptide repeat protein [Solihabitans fulvus]
MHNELTGDVHGFVLQARDVHVHAPEVTALAGLPPVDAGFTGRTAELALVAEALRSPRPVVVSTVMGLAGVGKTTLAIRAAHDAVEASLFPGGVLFMDLQGYSPQLRVEPQTALSIFLHALGVPVGQIPAEQAAREALYRTKLSERAAPVLIVLDNASSSDQVRPLLPPGVTHRVLVTSRHTLGELQGSRRIPLDVLSDVDSVAMLDTVLRAADPADQRIAADTEAAREIAELCGRLPLALGIVAALLSDDPRQPLTEVAASLREATTRLGELSYHENLAVRAAFDLSHARLGAEEARLFRLLSLNPGRQVSAEAAAAVIDLSPRETRKLLDGLCRAHMIEHGEPHGWFRFHDLLRLYAADRAAEEESAAGRRAATARLIDFYIDATELTKLRRPSVETRGQAYAWLGTERANLIGAVALAHQQGHHDRVLKLAFAMGTFLFYRRRHGADGLAAYELALDAAVRLGDRVSEARALRGLGRIHRAMDDYPAAWERFDAAAAVSQALGDHRGQARALHNLGSLARRSNDFRSAWQQYRRALDGYLAAGDRVGEAQIYFSMGLLARSQDNADLAVTHYRATIEICGQIGLHDLAGRAHKRLGVLALDLGDLPAARDHLEAAFTTLTAGGEHARAERVLLLLRKLRSPG